MSSSAAWVCKQDKENTIVIRRPEVFMNVFGNRPNCLFKPVVQNFKTNHGVSMYNVRVWDENEKVTRAVAFAVSTVELKGLTGTYGPQVLVDEDAFLIDGIDAVLEEFREAVKEKHVSVLLPDIESLSCRGGTGIYCDWPWKKDVVEAVEVLRVASQGMILLRGVNFNSSSNSIAAKLSFSAFPLGATKRKYQPAERVSETVASSAPAESESSATVGENP